MQFTSLDLLSLYFSGAIRYFFSTLFCVSLLSTVIVCCAEKRYICLLARSVIWSQAANNRELQTFTNSEYNWISCLKSCLPINIQHPFQYCIHVALRLLHKHRVYKFSWLFAVDLCMVFLFFSPPPSDQHSTLFQLSLISLDAHKPLSFGRYDFLSIIREGQTHRIVSHGWICCLHSVWVSMSSRLSSIESIPISIGVFGSESA